MTITPPGKISEHNVLNCSVFFYNFSSHIYVYFGPKRVLVLKSDLENLAFLILIEVTSFHFHISYSY
jgi:hypothetical protein